MKRWREGSTSYGALTISRLFGKTKRWGNRPAAPGADSEEKHEPVSDIDTTLVDSLKALDLNRPIREADMKRTPAGLAIASPLLHQRIPHRIRQILFRVREMSGLCMN